MKTIILMTLVLAASLVQAKVSESGFLNLLELANSQAKSSPSEELEYKDGNTFGQMTKEEMAKYHSSIVFGERLQKAEAFSVTAASNKSYTDCLQDGLIKAQVPAGMQSIYNPNTYVGKLFIDIKAGCSSLKTGSLETPDRIRVGELVPGGTAADQ